MSQPASDLDNARPAFARALRHWRGRRKVSQLELALASGISQRHLSALEVGRAQPSREMVLRLGEALRVPLREQNHLLTSAGFAARFRESALDHDGMAPVLAALELMLEHHEPYPALVVDWNWNVLRINRAVHRTFALAVDLDAMWQATCGDGPHNVFRATFHPEGLRPFIRNWDIVAPALIARTRREAEHHGTETLLELLAWVADDPSIPSEWTRAAVPDTRPVIPLQLGFGDLELSLFSMISTFGTPHDVTTDELRVECFFPADAASERMLRSLATG